jgi:hypothetical protein
MKYTLIVGLVSSALVLTIATVRAQNTFVDVPPCHWAAQAIGGPVRVKIKNRVSDKARGQERRPEILENASPQDRTDM